MPYDAAACAAKGAGLLDKVRPRWYLNVGYPDMSSGTHCVIGQLYGCYSYLMFEGRKPGSAFYGLDCRARRAEYGFVTPHRPDDHQADLLSAAWQREIDRRRGISDTPGDSPLARARAQIQ